MDVLMRESLKTIFSYCNIKQCDRNAVTKLVMPDDLKNRYLDLEKQLKTIDKLRNEISKRSVKALLELDNLWNDVDTLFPETTTIGRRQFSEDGSTLFVADCNTKCLEPTIKNMKHPSREEE